MQSLCSVVRGGDILAKQYWPGGSLNSRRPFAYAPERWAAYTLGTLHRKSCCRSKLPSRSDRHPLWSRHMSKRKPAKTSKRARSPKTATQAHRNKQDIVRSAKHLRTVATSPIEPPAERQHEPPHTEIEPKPPVGDRTGSLEDTISQMIRNAGSTYRPVMQDDASKKMPDYPLAMPDMLAFQRKLLEITQANMRLGFEFTLRMASVRTPYEFFDVMLAFTYRRFYLVTKLL